MNEINESNYDVIITPVGPGKNVTEKLNLVFS